MESFVRMMAPQMAVATLHEALNTQTHVSTVVPSGNKCLWVLWPAQVCFCTCIIFKTSSLRGVPRIKKINDLRFLDRQEEEVDLLQALDLHVLDVAASLGDWDPLLVLSLASASSAASARPGPQPQP